jgi:hypothetical protein
MNLLLLLYEVDDKIMNLNKIKYLMQSRNKLSFMLTKIKRMEGYILNLK